MHCSALILIFLLGLYSSQDPITPLQKYVKKDDGVFEWKVLSVLRGSKFDTYVINFTSQVWLTPNDTDASLWHHFLEIVVPANIDMNSPYAGLYVDGGDRGNGPPNKGDEFSGMLAVRTKNLIGHLQGIPNQPAHFYEEKPTPKRRKEDALLAYTWAHFINNTDQPEWLAKLPMVKAVIMAMNVMSEFSNAYHFGNVSKFIVAGASKRGWATWLAPACDDRIVAIIPMVMPILNMQAVINKLWRSLGLWSFVLDDYQELKLMNYLNTPEFTKMASIIDPLNYMHSLSKIPKYIITAAGDEFFIPDAHREFWHLIKGVKHMKVIPNAEHSLAGHAGRVIKQIAVFYNLVKTKSLPPPIKTEMIYSNKTASIKVWTSAKPSHVTLWRSQTFNTKIRDFRLITCPRVECFNPALWYSSKIQQGADGSYTASVSAPRSGWDAFLIEVGYGPEGSDEFWEITSEVNIVPDTYPYPPCGESGGCIPPKGWKSKLKSKSSFM